MTETVTFEDRFLGPLEPDTILPAQFFGALRQKAQPDGERRLMVAVLEDGVNCFRKNLFARDQKARQLYLDAEAWITESNRSWFFSFENVCDTLDLDADYIRQGLLKWRDEQLRKGPPASTPEAEGGPESLPKASRA